MWSIDLPFFRQLRLPSAGAERCGRFARPGLRAAGIIGTLVGLALAGPVRAEIKVGDFFPSLTATLPGATLPDTAGKVLLVDFWASWCAPCRSSFPAYARLQADYAARGLTLVAVSVDESAAAYEAFLRRMQPGFAVVRDQDHQLVQMVNVPAMPTCFLVGRDGRVRFIHRGFHGSDTSDQLRDEIEKMLNEKAPSP